LSGPGLVSEAWAAPTGKRLTFRAASPPSQKAFCVTAIGTCLGVTIAGVEVRDSDLAKRVCLLHAHGEEALGLHLGHAIDLHDHFVLTPRDQEAVRRVLGDGPPNLLTCGPAFLQTSSAESAARLITSRGLD
jgi:hypothetical protein